MNPWRDRAWRPRTPSPGLQCRDLHTARMKSRVHPKYKTKYRVTN